MLSSDMDLVAETFLLAIQCFCESFSDVPSSTQRVTPMDSRYARYPGVCVMHSLRITQSALNYMFMNNLHKKQNKDVKHSQEVKPVKKTTKKHASTKHFDKIAALKPIMAAAVKNINARKALKAEIEKAKSVYFDVKDSKDVTLPNGSAAAREMKLLDDELSMLKATVRSMFKQNQTFKLTVYYPWTISIAVTTGLVSGSQTVDPSALPEWIAAAELFDEYKVEGGDVRYRVKQAVNFASSVYPFYVICYDPTDNSAITSIAIGAAIQQHQVGVLPTTYESAAQHGAYADFSFKVPAGIQDTDGTSQGTGAWLPVTHPNPYGYLHFYCVGDYVVAATNGGFGANVSCHVTFRIRE